MAVTTAKYAGTITTSTPGDVDWTNGSNATGASDSSAATCLLDADEYTYTLKATNYDFSEIPDGSTIDEIVATVRRKRGTEGGRPIDEVVDLIVGGALDAQSKPDGGYWQSTIESQVYTWTDGVDTMPSAAEVKASDFGIAVQAVEGFADTVTASVYWISIVITYTAPAGGVVCHGDLAMPGLTMGGTVYQDASVSGDLAMPGIGLSGVSAPEAVVSGDMAIGGVTLAGTVYGDTYTTGDLAIGGITLAGVIGVGDGGNVVGNLPIGGVTLRGQVYLAAPGTIAGDSIPVYLTGGAVAEGENQHDPRESLGGFRSGARARSMTWDTVDPMIGIQILEVSGYNGRGVGALSAASADSLQWRAPRDSDAGEAVEIDTGEEAVIVSASAGAWIRVKRVGTVDLSGTHSVRVLDLYNDVIGFEDVANADAVAGLVDEIALMFKNEGDGWFRDLRFWIGTDNEAPIAIAAETPTAGELQASPSTGITWSSATTRATGIAYGDPALGEQVGLRIKRTIPALATASGTVLVQVMYSYDDNAGSRYTGELRGRYRVARTASVGYGVWVGVGAAPDLTAAPDETFTSFPHTTSLSLSNDETYHVVVRARNQWGLWSQNITASIIEVDGGGTAVEGRPDAPANIIVTQNSDNEARVAAVYDAGADDYPADLLVVWVDDAAPDGTGTPSGYQLVPPEVAYYDLAYTDTGVDWIDGTPIYALVRARRLLSGGGDVFAPDMIQLAASGTGSLKVSEELSGWGSSGYARTMRVTGELLEVWSYSAVTVGTGETTITVDARALLGTSGFATSEAIRCEPITWVDSDNTATATYTIVETAPGRPAGEVLLGDRAGVYQAKVSGPDGVTPVVIDAGNSHELLLGEGWASLYMDTALVWRFIWDTGSPERNGFYVPSEWTIVNAAVSGSAVDSGVWDSVDADTLYLVAGGVRRVKIDANAMEITVATLNDEATMPERITQAATLEQYAGTLLLSWDPGVEGYAVVGQLTGAGVLNVRSVLDNSLAQSAVEAL